MWRPYVKTNIYGNEKVMRDTKLYKTREEAIRNMKVKNKRWMELNYDKTYSKASNFEYGAVEVGKDGYKYKKGREGNKKLLSDLNKMQKSSSNFFEIKF